MAKTKTKLSKVLKDPVEEQDMPQPDPHWEARQERGERLNALAYQRIEKILLKTETLTEDDRSELEALRGIAFGYY